MSRKASVMYDFLRKNIPSRIEISDFVFITDHPSFRRFVVLQKNHGQKNHGEIKIAIYTYVYAGKRWTPRGFTLLLFEEEWKRISEAVEKYFLKKPSQ